MIGQGVVPLFTIAAATSLSDLTTTLCPDQDKGPPFGCLENHEGFFVVDMQGADIWEI